MKPFLQQLSDSLNDRQQFTLKAKKVGEDLVIYVETGNGRAHDVTAPAEDVNKEEIDHLFFEKILQNTQENKAEFQHQETEAPEKDDDDDSDESEEKDQEEKKSASKKNVKAPTKKQPVKKESAKKPATNPGKKTARETKAPVKEITEPEIEKTEQPETPVLNADPIESVQSEPSAEQNHTPTPPSTLQDDGPTADQLFDHFMAEGKRLFDDRKYREAEKQYSKALELKPGNEKAKKNHANAEKWAKAVEDMDKNKVTS